MSRRRVTLLPGRRLLERARLGRGHDGPQVAMHRVEQAEVGAPRGLGGLDRAREEVGAVERERAARGAGQTPPRRVLPVRGMDHQLPDVVRVRSGTPRRGLGLDAPERSPQVHAVPRHLVVGRVEQDQERIRVSHGSGLTAQAKAPSANARARALSLEPIPRLSSAHVSRGISARRPPRRMRRFRRHAPAGLRGSARRRWPPCSRSRRR